MEEFLIRNANSTDAPAIGRIYNYYILNTVITFEEQVITDSEIANRLADVSAASLPFLVGEQDGKIIGYAYANKWKTRSAYRFAVESSIYLDPDFMGKGFGKQLYINLIEKLKTRGIHTVIGGVALPNPASVALHEALGFTKVAEFHEVGFKFNQWIDVGYWELIL